MKRGRGGNGKIVKNGKIHSNRFHERKRNEEKNRNALKSFGRFSVAGAVISKTNGKSV